MPRILRSPPAVAALGVALSVASLSGCSGSGGSSSSPDPLPTTTHAGKVVLPTGLSLDPKGLTVVDALGQGSVSGAGAFSLPAYSAGPQLAIVENASGNAMLLGWLDGEHATIDSESTAEVLVYFASGCPMLPPAIQLQAIEAIPQVAGIPAVRAALEAALASSPDALAAPVPALQQALAAAVAQVVPAVPAAIAPPRPRDINVKQGAQSGVTLITAPPFAAYLQNAARRRAWGFVERVDDNSADGTRHCSADPSPAPYPPVAMTDFQVTPVYGLNGGVFQAFTDIMNAAYGNQTTAYAPVDSPPAPFSVPMVTGSTQTCYRVRVVGPGRNEGVKSSLSASQQLQLTQVSIQAFASDSLLPLLSNAMLGSGVVDFGAGQGSPTYQFAAKLLAAFTTDLTAALPQFPGLQDQIVSGQWKAAVTTLFASSTTLRTILETAFHEAAASTQVKDLPPGSLAKAFQGFAQVIDKAGAALQIFDTGAQALALYDADQADQWDLVVLQPKVTLSPAGPSPVGLGGTVTLTAAVLGVEDASSFSYRWTTPALSTDTLKQVGGAGQQGSSFCASTNQVLYYQSGAVATGTTNTVTVTAYPVASCQGTSLGSATASLVYADAAITPAGTTVLEGTHQKFTVTLASGSLPAGTKVTWTLQTGTGTLNGQSAPVTTTTATVDYLAPLVPESDLLAVALTDAGGGSLGSAHTSFAVVPLVVTPPKPHLGFGERQTFTAAGDNGFVPSNVSYRWTLTGDGSLGGASPMTTTAPDVTYTAPSAATTDTLQVQIVDLDGHVSLATPVSISVGVLVFTGTESWNTGNGLDVGTSSDVILENQVDATHVYFTGSSTDYKLDGTPEGGSTFTCASQASPAVVSTSNGNVSITLPDGCTMAGGGCQTTLPPFTMTGTATQLWFPGSEYTWHGSHNCDGLTTVSQGFTITRAP
jgi:hypothetical protein